jgi:hypothetical protein
MFYPVYLRRCGFRSNQSYIRLQTLEDFKAARSIHRFPDLESRIFLSVLFDSEDFDAKVAHLAYAVVHIPVGTILVISVHFAFCGPIGLKSLCNLFNAFAHSCCSDLCIYASEIQEVADIPMLAWAWTTWPLVKLTLNLSLDSPVSRRLLSYASISLKEIAVVASYDHTFSAEWWSDLLAMAHFPQLTALSVSEDAPPSLLLDFLDRHPKVSVVKVNTKPLRKDAIHDIQKVHDLRSLTTLSGPPSYILSILRSATAPQSLSILSLFVEHLPTPAIFSAVLQCLSACQRVGTLEVALSREGVEAVLDPEDELAARDFTSLDVKILQITLSPRIYLDVPDVDILVSRCHWS